MNTLDDRENDNWHDEIREKIAELNLTQRQQEKKINELVRMGKEKAMRHLSELDGNTHHMTRYEKSHFEVFRFFSSFFFRHNNILKAQNSTANRTKS